MSPDRLRRYKLPPNAPAGLRVRLYVMRFLAHHNRLEGYMAFACMVWGGFTMAFPDFWGDWPVTSELVRWTGGHPWVVSVCLFLAGAGSYVARRRRAKRTARQQRRLDRLRSACHLLAFSNWAMLGLIFVLVDPMFSPAVASYGIFAAAQLISYVNFVVQVDQEQDDDDAEPPA